MHIYEVKYKIKIELTHDTNIILMSAANKGKEEHKNPYLARTIGELK